MLNAGIEAIEGGGADHCGIVGTQGDRWDAHWNRGAPVEFLAQAKICRHAPSQQDLGSAECARCFNRLHDQHIND